MIFDAKDLARGWLSVALASGKDSGRPALDRTVCIETFATGVRLAATDSYVLLHSWVPSVERSAAWEVAEPSLDESPHRTVVAMDPHGRGAVLLTHLLKLATAKDAPPIEVRLNIGVSLDDDGPPSLEGMSAEAVLLEHPDHERLRLGVYEGAFPNWRKVTAGFEPASTSALALNPEIIGRLAKLDKYHAGRPLRWRFGGENRMALVEVADGEPAVAGAAMPVRWDFDRDEPRVDVAKDEDKQAEEDEAPGGAS